MSSLIVVEVALAEPEDNYTGQSFAWIQQRIRDQFSTASKRYETLTSKTERVSKLYGDLSAHAETILNTDNPAWKKVDDARKAMESFFRKSDRFRITLIQLLLEENEIHLMEETYVNQIRQFLSNIITDRLMSPENLKFSEFSGEIAEISRKELPSDRIADLKKLISDLAAFYYICKQAKTILQKQIADTKKDVTSLELLPISLPDLEILHSLQNRLASLPEIPDIILQETRLLEIENEVSAFSHRLSGIEYTDMAGIVHTGTGPDTGTGPGINMEQIDREASLALLALEANFFHGRIRFFDYDNTETDDYEQVAGGIPPDRLALQRDNLQLEYGLLKEKLPEKTVIREELEEMIQSLSVDPDAGALLDAALILYHDPFPELRELSVIRRQYNLYFLQKTSKSLSDEHWNLIIKKFLELLESRGYRVRARKIQNFRNLFRKGNIEVFTPMHHYSVMISINPLDELVFRLVRVIDGFGIDELDAIQVKKDDTQSDAVWNHDFTILTEELKEHKIIFIERLRKNSEEVSIQQLTRFDLLTDEHIS